MNVTLSCPNMDSTCTKVAREVSTGLWMCPRTSDNMDEPRSVYIPSASLYTIVIHMP